MMTSQIDLLRQLLTDLERVMKLERLWSDSSPTKTALDSQVPFAVDTLKIEQWLQFIFIPKMKLLIESDEPLPASMEVLPILQLNLNERDYPKVINVVRNMDLWFEPR